LTVPPHRPRKTARFRSGRGRARAAPDFSVKGREYQEHAGFAAMKNVAVAGNYARRHFVYTAAEALCVKPSRCERSSMA